MPIVSFIYFRYSLYRISLYIVFYNSVNYFLVQKNKTSNFRVGGGAIRQNFSRDTLGAHR